jgi:cellulase
VIDYLAPCPGECTKATVRDLSFTKVAEQGLIKPGKPGAAVYATDSLIKNNSTWIFTVPKDLKFGNYVLRNEIIALHTAGTVGGAQNYPQCFNLRVKGDGKTALPKGIPGTKLYTPSTPGILFNIAADVQKYPIPGPPLWKGA